MDAEDHPMPGVGRWVELAALYFVLPAALTAARCLAWRHLPVIPVLWVVALPASIWLARHGLGREELFGSVPRLREAPRLVLRAAVLAVPLVVLMYFAFPESFFALPRRNIVFWLVIMVCYPLLSVFPQGIIYRGFFLGRYGPLFSSPLARRIVAALCFSFSHVFFLNAWALALTFVGGLFFMRTYERTGSLFLANFEHALYGDLLFTIGYGSLFLYHGTLALVGT